MRLLSLDLDGVLHPAHDAVMINFRPGTPMFQVEVALRAQGRFVWMNQLEQALEGHDDVRIVFHTTWRRRFSDRELTELLSPVLRDRVICLDGMLENRNNCTADEYVQQVVEMLQPSSLCVIDDRPEFFEQGLAARWMTEHGGQFVWCHPDLGLSSCETQQALRGWADGEHEHFDKMICQPGADDGHVPAPPQGDTPWVS